MIQKIISGGQTGVDRAALDFAIAQGIPHGGWCPKGRLAEDGVIPERYELRETDTEELAVRTEQNVIDSDATLILNPEESLTGGTALTRELARQYDKPFCVAQSADEITSFLHAHQPRVLNIAGPRASDAPGVYAWATALLGASV